MRKVVTVAVVGVLLLLVGGCGGGDSDEALLVQCESARLDAVAAVDPVFYDDPDFAWESMQKPLTAVESSVEFDTGVTEVTGTTDGREWVCLIDNGGARWAWGE